jgi:hypothetical protein
MVSLIQIFGDLNQGPLVPGLVLLTRPAILDKDVHLQTFWQWQICLASALDFAHLFSSICWAPLLGQVLFCVLGVQGV